MDEEDGRRKGEWRWMKEISVCMDGGGKRRRKRGD